MVLESAGHGPQLCLGGIETSYPPGCGGPDIVGWDWDLVDDEQSTGGTTWGDYTVVGTWDGQRLTMSRDPGPAEWPEPEPVDFSTPCEAPEGGWANVDPAIAGPDDLDAALAAVREEPDFAGVRVDESITPTVVNVRFTGDVERHEAELRELWGGPLCLVEADVALSELLTVQAELLEELGALSGGIDEADGVVRLTVVVADPALQDELDARYGAGVVEVTGALQPID